MRVSIELTKQNATTFEALAKDAGKTMAQFIENELAHKARDTRGAADLENALRTCSECGRLNMPGASDTGLGASDYIAPKKCTKCGRRLTRIRDRFRSPAMRGALRLSSAE